MIIESPHPLNFQIDMVYYMVNWEFVECIKTYKRESKLFNPIDYSYVYEFRKV
jgi:hypothetical protein